MTTTALIAEDLALFDGSDQFYAVPYNPRVRFTEGVKYLIETGDAHWLLHKIITAGMCIPAVAAEEFQSWKLSVRSDQTAEIECSDGKHNIVFREEISWTDFPLESVRVLVTGGIVLLPSEY